MKRRILPVAALVLLLGALAVWAAVGWPLPALPQLEAGASLLTVALFGALTSFHCIGMCGGTLLAFCAEGQPLAQSLRFLLGRLLVCTLVGALFGALGQTISINPWLRGLLPIACAAAMFLSALHLSGFFRWLRLPAPAERDLHSKAGAFVSGMLTALLPCGMLQLVQLYALGSGSALHGAAALLVFALASSPLLGAFGALAGLLNLKGLKYIRWLTAAVLLLMGTRMLLKGLRLMGG